MSVFESIRAGCICIATMLGMTTLAQSQTMLVTVTVSPATIYVGGNFSLTVRVTLDNASYAVNSFTGSCTSTSGDDVNLSLTVHGQPFNYYSSFAQTIEAPDEAGADNFLCSVEAHYVNGKSLTMDGSATINVVSCQGSVNATPAPNVQDGTEASNTSIWNNLTGTVEPSGNVSSPPMSASGYGITGQLDNPELASNLLDCDDDPNDDIPEQDASIKGSAEAPVNGQVVFTWDVTSYVYSSANACDSCDENPEGHYPITEAEPVAMPKAASSSAYCQ